MLGVSLGLAHGVPVHPSLSKVYGTIATPHAAQTIEEELIALGVALDAAGLYKSAGIIDVEGARFLGLELGYESHAVAGTGGLPSVIVMVSGASAQPAAADESWYPLVASDGSLTAAALLGALPANTDFAINQFAKSVQYPLNLPLPAATANSQKVKGAATVNVTPWRWAQVLVAEAGSTLASPGKLGVKFTLGV